MEHANLEHLAKLLNFHNGAYFPNGGSQQILKLENPLENGSRGADLEHGNLEPKICCLLGRFRIPPKQSFSDVAISIPQISRKLSCGDARPDAVDEGYRYCPRHGDMSDWPGSL